jgi:hypothetical protein
MGLANIHCPKGLSRPLTLPDVTGLCVLTHFKCYEDMRSDVACEPRCKIPCGANLQCSQLQGLSCGVNKVRLRQQWW